MAERRLLSPYEYWQFWRNAEDADVGRFLKLYTELPLDEIARLDALEGGEINEAKKVLATEATALLHGRAAAEEAAEAARRTFEEGGLAEALPTIAATLPAGILDLLLAADFVKSKGEARRLVAQSGIRLNDAPVGDPQMEVTAADLRDGAAKLSLGRKRHVLVRKGVGLDPGLIDEDQPARVDLALMGLPAGALEGDVRARLLGGQHGFF